MELFKFVCMICVGLCCARAESEDYDEIVPQDYLRWNYTYMNPKCSSPGASRSPCQDIRNCRFAAASLAMGGWPTLCGWVGRGVPKVCCGLPLVLGPTLMKQVFEEKARNRECGTNLVTHGLSDTESKFLLIVNSLPKMSRDGTDVFDTPLDFGIPTTKSSVPTSELRQGDFPWMVSVWKNGFHVCGGSLLDRNHILTAAHCVLENKDQYNVHVGNLYVDDGYEINITKIVIHPGYKKEYSYKDLAILTLSEEILTPMIPHICLPDPDKDDIAPGRNTTVLRWGTITEDGETRQVLCILDGLSVVPLKVCQENYKVSALDEIPNNVIQDFICTESSQTYEKACKTDSGGPLIYRRNAMDKSEDSPWTLIGIDSFGSMCGDVHSRGLFTRVSHHMDWIEKTMNE